MTKGNDKNTSGKLSKRLYNEAEAATYLGRTLWSMRELRYSGNIPFINGGRRKFYDIQDLDSWIERNKTQNTYWKIFSIDGFSVPGKRPIPGRAWRRGVGRIVRVPFIATMIFTKTAFWDLGSQLSISCLQKTKMGAHSEKEPRVLTKVVYFK